MATVAPGDRARASVGVAVPPAQAFRIFTEEIELWWRRGPRFRYSRGDAGLIALEPRVGGRVFESFTVDGAPHVVEIGRIRVWQPPQRLLFDWQVANGTPLERTGTAEEVADAIAFLASDRARFITGQNLVIDGGMGLAQAGIDETLRKLLEMMKGAKR